MAVTNIRGTQVKDGDITRQDLNTLLSGSAVIAKLVAAAGTGIEINASSGVDIGTGDVSLKLNETYADLLYPRLSFSRTLKTFLAAPSGADGNASFRAIVASDIPTLNQNTTGTAATVTGAAQVAITSVGTLTTLAVTGGISAAGISLGAVSINGAYSKILMVGGTNTAEVYSDGANLILANNNMIYLQSVAGSLFAKGQKSGSDTWFEMFANGVSRAKTMTSGFSVAGCGYFSNGIEVTGDIKATGDGFFFNTVSDMRLKKDFEPIGKDYAMGIVRQSKPYWFTWKEGVKMGQRDFGFGAQDMEQILPEMVQHRPDGTLGLYYEHYTAVLSAALQYLDQEVLKLTKELNALKNGQ